jgi:cyclophilin family peptidyl-prolyl cis-trans isomerase
MFKENREFWLYLLGIIVMFFVLFFGIRSYMSSNDLSFSGIMTVPEVYPSYDTEDPEVTPSDTVAGTPVAEVSPTTDTVPLDPEKDYYAVIKTNRGDITVELFEANAPNTVANFISLSTKDYYNETRFHRIIKDVLLQGGSRNTHDDDPDNDKFGNPGYIFDDEINWDSLDYFQSLRGKLIAEGYSSAYRIASVEVAKFRLAMANSAPNTNGSQFFFILDEITNPTVEALRGKHTVFGEVVGNYELIEEINKEAPAQEAFPDPELYITSVEIFTKN